MLTEMLFCMTPSHRTLSWIILWDDTSKQSQPQLLDTRPYCSASLKKRSGQSSVRNPTHQPSIVPTHKCSTGSDFDFSTDDIGLDLGELQTLSGFLMNEAPDSTGHFYPPWMTDLDPITKDEPIASYSSTPKEQQQQQQQHPPLRSAGAVAKPMAEPKVDISVGALIAGTPARFATGINAAATATPTLKKSASGGVTRRRSSSKEEQAKKRRERNRVLARRTRLRKKFFFQSLQQQVKWVRLAGPDRSAVC